MRTVPIVPAPFPSRAAGQNRRRRRQIAVSYNNIREHRKASEFSGAKTIGLQGRSTRLPQQPIRTQGFGSLFRRLSGGIRSSWLWTTFKFSRLLPTVRAILCTHATASVSTWCSQILSTFQRRRRSFLVFLLSRSRLQPILFRQKAGSLWCQTGNLHPCQKSPFTKTATLASAKTKSGRPGSARSCCVNLSREAFNRARIYRSGVVFFPLILDITRLRCCGDMMSTTDGHPRLQAKWFSPQA